MIHYRRPRGICKALNVLSAKEVIFFSFAGGTIYCSVHFKKILFNNFYYLILTWAIALGIFKAMRLPRHHQQPCRSQESTSDRAPKTHNQDKGSHTRQSERAPLTRDVSNCFRLSVVPAALLPVTLMMHDHGLPPPAAVCTTEAGIPCYTADPAYSKKG